MHKHLAAVSPGAHLRYSVNWVPGPTGTYPEQTDMDVVHFSIGTKPWLTAAGAYPNCDSIMSRFCASADDGCDVVYMCPPTNSMPRSGQWCRPGKTWTNGHEPQ